MKVRNKYLFCISPQQFSLLFLSGNFVWIHCSSIVKLWNGWSSQWLLQRRLCSDHCNCSTQRYLCRACAWLILLPFAVWLYLVSTWVTTIVDMVCFSSCSTWRLRKVGSFWRNTSWSVITMTMVSGLFGSAVRPFALWFATAATVLMSRPVLMFWWTGTFMSTTSVRLLKFPTARPYSSMARVWRSASASAVIACSLITIISRARLYMVVSVVWRLCRLTTCVRLFGFEFISRSFFSFCSFKVALFTLWWRAFLCLMVLFSFEIIIVISIAHDRLEIKCI